MKEFKLKITEVSTKTTKILAENKKEAIKIMGDVYQKYTPFFQVEDIESKEISIKSEEAIDEKYLEKFDLIDNALLVCELEEDKFYMYEDVKYSLFDIGLIKKENDIVWITNIFYTDDCPDEKENISFYFKPTRSYGVLNYQKYKAKTIREVFAIENELFSSYQEKSNCKENDYFVIETSKPFQELTSTLFNEIRNQKK